MLVIYGDMEIWIPGASTRHSYLHSLHSLGLFLSLSLSLSLSLFLSTAIYICFLHLLLEREVYNWGGRGVGNK